MPARIIVPRPCRPKCAPAPIARSCARTIKAEVAIPLERPRQQSMMMSSEFLALRRGLMSLIGEESLKAIGGEVNEIALQGLGIDLHGQTLADVI
jgi:NitT/TauT family transport system ATP-binding protein